MKSLWCQLENKKALTNFLKKVSKNLLTATIEIETYLQYSKSEFKKCLYNTAKCTLTTVKFVHEINSVSGNKFFVILIRMPKLYILLFIFVFYFCWYGSQ